MATVFDLLAKLGLDKTNFATSLEQSNREVVKFAKTTEKRFKEIGKGFKNLGSDMLKLAAIPALAIGGSVRAYVIQAQAVAQLEQAIKSTGGVAGYTSRQLQDMASALQAQTNFGDEAIIKGQALLLTFTGIKEALPDTTALMLDMSQAMGQDLKSTAIQLGKALNDPTKGLTALSRVGVSFSKQQAEQIKTLQESGKVYEAQKVILAELNKEFGGQAKAAADVGAHLIPLKNAMGDLSEDIGKSFIPAIEAVTTRMLKIIPPIRAWIQAHPKLTTFMGGTTLAVTALIGGLGILFIALGQIAFAISSLAALLKTKMIASLAAFAKTSWAAVAPWLVWGVAIGVVIAGLTLLDEKWRKVIASTEIVRKVTDGLFIAWTNLFENIKTFILNQLDKMITGFKDFALAAKQTVTLGAINTEDERGKLKEGLAQRTTDRNANRDANVAAAYDSSIYGESGRAQWEAEHNRDKENFANGNSPMADLAKMMGLLSDKIDANTKATAGNTNQSRRGTVLGTNRDMIPAV